jgi:hypothetical protein
MKRYLYSGPVLEFERVIANKWEASTCAQSPSKARSNLTFRFKKEHNKATNSKISLPGKLIVVEEEDA